MSTSLSVADVKAQLAAAGEALQDEAADLAASHPTAINGTGTDEHDCMTAAGFVERAGVWQRR